MFNPNTYINNPFFLIDDPHKDHRTALKLSEEAQIELERLCYEIFHINDNGIKLWEILQEKFVNRGLFELGSKNKEFFQAHPELMSFYWEAFKDALRGLHINGLKHKQRITTGIQ